MRESTIERAVCEYARREYNMLTRKLTGELTSGWPDRMLLTEEGYICFIEFKAPDGELRPQQERMCRKLITYGFDVFICDDIEKGKRLVDYVSDANLIKEVIHGYDPAVPGPELILPARLSDARHQARRGPPDLNALVGHGPGKDGGDADSDS